MILDNTALVAAVQLVRELRSGRQHFIKEISSSSLRRYTALTHASFRRRARNGDLPVPSCVWAHFVPGNFTTGSTWSPNCERGDDSPVKLLDDAPTCSALPKQAALFPHRWEGMRVGARNHRRIQAVLLPMRPWRLSQPRDGRGCTQDPPLHRNKITFLSRQK